MLTIIKRIQIHKNFQDINLSNNSCRGQFSEEISNSIFFLLKIYDNKLRHIDVSHMGFNEDEVLKIAGGVIQSKSLQSIHLTGNQVNDLKYIYPKKLKKVLQP